MSHYEFNVDYPLDDCAIYTDEYNRNFVRPVVMRKVNSRSVEGIFKDIEEQNKKSSTPKAREEWVKRIIAARREWEKQQKTLGVKK